jgi:hypothetical protein
MGRDLGIYSAEGEAAMTAPTPPATALLDWLSEWRRDGLTRGGAIDRFLQLPPVDVDDMIGQWQRWELPTDHTIDRLLADFGLYGKTFVSADECYPLVMIDRNGSHYSINPLFVPLHLLFAYPSLFNQSIAHLFVRYCGRLFATKKPKAILRPVALGGTVSAAMIYDAKPVIDHFRRIDDQTCICLMEYRHFDRPLFFLLTRI